MVDRCLVNGKASARPLSSETIWVVQRDPGAPSVSSQGSDGALGEMDSSVGVGVAAGLLTPQGRRNDVTESASGRRSWSKNSAVPHGDPCRAQARYRLGAGDPQEPARALLDVAEHPHRMRPLGPLRIDRIDSHSSANAVTCWTFCQREAG